MSKHIGMATRLEEKLKRLLKPISHIEEFLMRILILSIFCILTLDFEQL